MKISYGVTRSPDMIAQRNHIIAHVYEISPQALVLGL